MQRQVNMVLLLIVALVVSSTEQVLAQDKMHENGQKVLVADSLLSATMLEDVGDHLRAYCVWDGRSSDSALIDQGALQSAIDNSLGWIKAVLRPEYVPDDLETQIQGVVDDAMGRDATRVRFEGQGLRFLVTQTASHIIIVVRPHDDNGGDCCSSTAAPEGCARAIIDTVFTHGKVILHMSSLMENVPSGIRIHVRTPPSEVEDPRAFAEQQRTLEDELRRLDGGLPNHLRAGPFFHWWGTVYAMSDGCAVLVQARKCTGGGVMADLVKGWFRKEKLPSPYTGRFSPRPPLDTAEEPPANRD